MTQMTAIPAISDLPIYNTLMANRSSALLSVAVSLGLFDAIASCSATEIVNASWVKAKYEFSLRGADALLVGLKCLNLLESLPTSTPDAWYDIQYQLTPLSRFYLLSNSEHYLGHLILMDAESFLTPQGLLEAFKKDKPVVYGGQDPWEHQEADSASAERVILFTYVCTRRLF